MAYGVALSIAERFSCPWQLVTPQRWKKDMKLTSDKKESLSMARQLWPTAPLKRLKDNGRAEALLLAEWFRRQDV
jgi:crossover junction endodeoxyribonuclease RuvC